MRGTDPDWKVQAATWGQRLLLRMGELEEAGAKAARAYDRPEQDGLYEALDVFRQEPLVFREVGQAGEGEYLLRAMRKAVDSLAEECSSGDQVRIEDALHAFLTSEVVRKLRRYTRPKLGGFE